MLRSWVIGLSLLATPVLADPCEAIPEQGPLPTYLSFAAEFSGPVVHVIDGDSLCVAVGPGHEKWVEVRLADFHAPESGDADGPSTKAALARIALGQPATCVASLRTYDRIAARCSIAGQPIGDAMHASGGKEGGNGSRPPFLQSRGLMSDTGPISGAFRNCASARAAGAAPVRRGSPGYGAHLDADGDGVACEPYRGR